MHTTPTADGIARILVRLSSQDRQSKMNHQFLMPDGSAGTIITKLPQYQEVDKWELNVSLGTVIGMSPGVTGVAIGDGAIVDYIIDCDEQYQVGFQGADKIVAVPCQTRIHDTDNWVTSYGSWRKDTKEGPRYWAPHPEKNIKVWGKGDVDQLSLLLGTFAGRILVPHDSYLFCEPAAPVSTTMVAKNGIFSYDKPDKRVLRRQILACSVGSGFTAGQVIYAIPDSNFELKLPGRIFDMIPVHEVVAIEEKI